MNQEKSLNIFTFTNPNGSNYRKEGMIDLSSLSKKLEIKGIRPIELTQLWRNVTGKVCYNGQARFFKMASTEAISQKLENEVLWNNFANSNLQSFGLSIPKIIKNGKIGDLSFISQNLLKDIL